MIQNLIGKLCGHEPKQIGCGVWSWSLENNGSYNTRSVY